MEYYIDKLGLSDNYDKAELKRVFKNKIKEINNISNLSDNDKEIYLNHLSEIYDDLKNNILKDLPVKNNIDLLNMSKNNFGINNSYRIMRDKDGTILVIEKDETIENGKKKENTQSYLIKNNIKKDIDYNEAEKNFNIRLTNPLLKFLKI